jgi:MinD-like ATPase involved in chromosome partitioning or flagellar assembly
MSADQHEARPEGDRPPPSTNGRGVPPDAPSAPAQVAPYISDDGRFWWDVDDRGWRSMGVTSPPARPPAAASPVPTAADEPAAEARPEPGPAEAAADAEALAGVEAAESAHAGEAEAPVAPGDEPEFAVERFLRQSQAPAPKSGFRAAIYRLSGGTVNLGPSPQERREHVLVAQARTPIRGDVLKVAIASAKGGAGKTTTCLGLGMALGSLRNDHIVALEANTSMGTFGVRVPMEHDLGMAQLLTEIDGVRCYADLRRFTTHIPENRLEVLASPLDPTRATAFTEEDVRRVLELLTRYENLILEDMGIDLLHGATSHLLRTCDFVVVVSPDSYDGGKLANDLLDWLATRRGRGWLKQRALVVINRVRRDTLLEVDAMAGHFSRRARGCLRVRFDRHLDAGGHLHWDQLAEGTRQDYLELAAALATGFPLGPAEDLEATC